MSCCRDCTLIRYATSFAGINNFSIFCTGGFLGYSFFHVMPLWHNCLLRFQHYPTYGTMASCSLSFCSTASLHSLIDHLCMTFRQNLCVRDLRSICTGTVCEKSSACLAFIMIHYSSCCTGRFHTLNMFNRSVSCLRDYFLFFYHCTTS